MSIRIHELVDFVEVPEGYCEIGWSDGEAEERPPRRVFIPAFRIGRVPVTAALWTRFTETTGHSWQPVAERVGPDQPATNLSWFDSMAFLSWLSEQLGFPCHLPNEAQWEKAARGPAGGIAPWGNRELGWEEFDPGRWVDRRPAVGERPDLASPYGCLDMCINIREWCANWFAVDLYETWVDGQVPSFPATGSDKVAKGPLPVSGGWPRCSYREYYAEPSYRGPDIGIRICADV